MCAASRNSRAENPFGCDVNQALRDRRKRIDVTRQQDAIVTDAHQQSEFRHFRDEGVEHAQRSRQRFCNVADARRLIAVADDRLYSLQQRGIVRRQRGSMRRIVKMPAGFADSVLGDERRERVVEPAFGHDPGAADLVGFETLAVRRGFVVRGDLCGQRVQRRLPAIAGHHDRASVAV